MRNRNSSRGFSLIEVMVALVISLFLVAGLVSTFTSTNKTYGEITKTGRQIENGRYAIELLEDDIEHAGFFGEFTGSYDSSGSPALVAPDPCNDTAYDKLNGSQVFLPIYGYDGYADAASSPLSTCLSDYKPHTDILVIRRASTVPATTLDANAIYVQGLFGQIVISGGDPTAFNLTYALGPKVGLKPPIRPYVEHIYYVSTCSRCDGSPGDDQIPTLSRLELQPGGTFQRVPLVEGIENIQFYYGVDNSSVTKGAPVAYRFANDYQYDTSLTQMRLDPDWDNVVSVQVNVLARNTEATTAYKNTNTYQLGSSLDPDATVAAANDNYRRHAFSATVRAYNLAGKKEW